MAAINGDRLPLTAKLNAMMLYKKEIPKAIFKIRVALLLNFKKKLNYYRLQAGRFTESLKTSKVIQIS
ncbi:MAG: hypothetical protein ORN54_01300 [Cyclobacteriaceae bacterium]|nr:hypothetical protein [Cyclobacteriaceae bacterium]